MTTEAIAATRPPQRAAPSDAEIQGFDERWAAWQARGRAHDRAGRRRLGIVILIAGIATALTFVVFF
jgi:hypothetical protein